jgi:uncharacterized protein YraI
VKENDMRYRIFLVLCLTALLALTACNLSSSPPTEEPLPGTPINPSGKPEVTIVSPEDGDEFVVDEEILVSANATDSVGITRVQLLANSRVVKSVSSESPSGDLSKNFLLDYTPENEGDIELEVIAFRGAVASDPVSISVSIREDEAQVTATSRPAPNVPVIDPNDPTCRALVNAGLNLRSGPGTSFNRITVLATGTVVPIIGRLGDNSWWQVRSGTTIGWVSAQYTTIYGNCGGIPVVTPPPTPGNPPTNTFVPPTWTFRPPATSTPPPSVTPTLPDLIVTSIEGERDVTTGPGSDSAIPYAVTITNLGGRRSGQFYSTISINGDERDLGIVADLGPNESIVLTSNILFDTPGDYTLLVQLDVDEEVTEISEVNNSGILQVTVTLP